jgi:hypothetical protein
MGKPYTTHKRHTSLLVRFWSFVDERGPDECWGWQGGRDRQGYGQMTVRRGKTLKAHRLSWELAHHCEIPDGMMIRHTCDNPSCVNPAHLLVGTNVDNMHDLMERGDSKKLARCVLPGERHRSSKLTADQVCEMRRLHRENGHGAVELARRYGVHRCTAWEAITHRTWKHIE